MQRIQKSVFTVIPIYYTINAATGSVHSLAEPVIAMQEKIGLKSKQDPKKDLFRILIMQEIRATAR